MEQSVNEVSIISGLLRNSKEILERIDDDFTEFNDIAEEVGKYLSPVKYGIQALNMIKKIKFKKFLKELADSLIDEKIGAEYYKRLERYLKNEKNLEYIAETIEASIQTKSSTCSAMMGYYAGIILHELKELEYKDFVIINALKSLNDMDINYFKFLYRKFNESSQSIRIHDMQKEIDDSGVNRFELENSIEKLKNIQILGYDVGGMSNVGNAWGAFQINEYSHEFFNIIIKFEILDE